MSDESSKRLLAMIGDLLEGDLCEVDAAELNGLLKADPEARTLYREHMELHARLHLDYSGGALLSSMPGEPPKNQGPVAVSCIGCGGAAS
jgi:hypothetical protein